MVIDNLVFSSAREATCCGFIDFVGPFFTVSGETSFLVGFSIFCLSFYQCRTWPESSFWWAVGHHCALVIPPILLTFLHARVSLASDQRKVFKDFNEYFAQWPGLRVYDSTGIYLFGEQQQPFLGPAEPSRNVDMLKARLAQRDL